MREFIGHWKQQACQLKLEVYALYLAYQDPRVPLSARVFTACVVGYAFSPIDLIPDFIPVLGYLDDLILIPLGIKIAVSMIPANVMIESRAKAHEIIRKSNSRHHYCVDLAFPRGMCHRFYCSKLTS